MYLKHYEQEVQSAKVHCNAESVCFHLANYDHLCLEKGVAGISSFCNKIRCLCRARHSLQEKQPSSVPQSSHEGSLYFNICCIANLLFHFNQKKEFDDLHMDFDYICISLQNCIRCSGSSPINSRSL